MIGFVKYNGMSAEKFIAAWVKSEILMPKHLTFGNTNMYCRIMTEAQKQQEKAKKKRCRARRRKHDKDTEQNA